MLSVFALLMSDTTSLCNKICYTYLGNEMDPSPYLLILWLKCSGTSIQNSRH